MIQSISFSLNWKVDFRVEHSGGICVAKLRPIEVKAKMVDFHHTAFTRGLSPELGVDPDPEDHQGEGLGNIVVILPRFQVAHNIRF